MTRIWKWQAALAAVLSVALLGVAAVPQAKAAPISQESGNGGFFDLMSDGNGNVSLVFGPGNVQTQNGMPSNPYPTQIAPLTLHIDSYQVDPKGNYTFTFTGSSTQSTNSNGTALFSFSITSGGQLGATPQILNLTGTNLLVSNTSDLDYSPFLLGGIFNLTLTSTSVPNLADILINGGEAIGSSSYSSIAVPLPPTIVMLGMGVPFLGGFLVLRGRRPAPKPAVA